MNLETIDCEGLDFKNLNARIRRVVKMGARRIKLLNVNGQRYICGGIKGEIRVEIHGFPGNDLGVFMDGPVIEVYGNAGDGVGNTMNDGMIIVHGDVGDVAGYSMGGRIYIKGDAGYRLGIHLKEFGSKKPIVVVGGDAGDFLGEYMAGGVIIVLRLNSADEDVESRFIATGIHGGRIYLRGRVDKSKIGFGASISDLSEEDLDLMKNLIDDFCKYTGCSRKGISLEKFTKIIPISKRPFEKLYHQTSIKMPGRP